MVFSGDRANCQRQIQLILCGSDYAIIHMQMVISQPCNYPAITRNMYNYANAFTKFAFTVWLRIAFPTIHFEVFLLLDNFILHPRPYFNHEMIALVVRAKGIL